MQYKHNKTLVPLSKSSRNNMTKEERKLWYDFLRNYPVKFIRQKIIGNYIVDFYSAQLKLIIEVDGIQHYSEDGIKYDSERTAFLEGYGLKIIRIRNTAVNNDFDKVCRYLDQHIMNLTNTSSEGTHT